MSSARAAQLEPRPGRGQASATRRRKKQEEVSCREQRDAVRRPKPVPPHEMSLCTELGATPSSVSCHSRASSRSGQDASPAREQEGPKQNPEVSNCRSERMLPLHFYCSRKSSSRFWEAKELRRVGDVEGFVGYHGPLDSKAMSCRTSRTSLCSHILLGPGISTHGCCMWSKRNTK